MEKIKLSNGTAFELVVNGISEYGDTLNLTFQPAEQSFDAVEGLFADSKNTNKIYILDSAGEPMRSIVGYTEYKGLSKTVDYVLSTETVNKGSEDEPNYVEETTTDTVMSVTLAKPDIAAKVAELETASDNIMLALAEIYEGSM